MVKKQTILKWMFTTLWVVIGAGVIVLLAAAIHKEESRKCTGINVVIKGVSNNFFVDKKEILQAINEYIDGQPEGQPVHILNLKSLEADLQKNIWVKSAQLFFDNNAVLQVRVTEREPVARVFSSTGNTFYIDSSIAMLPLSDKYSARLPVFTNFPSDKKVLNRTDSLLLRNIYTLSMALQADPFWMGMIEQVDITPRRTFELLPKIGNTIIVFGDASNATEKLRKLLVFYKKVMAKTGWDKYSVVNVQYANQVVASRKDAEDKTTDSIKTLQLMQLMAAAAEQQANDSLQAFTQDNEHNTTNVNLIQQSLQRDDSGENADASETTAPLGIGLKIPPLLGSHVIVKKPATVPLLKPLVQAAVNNNKQVIPVLKPVVKPAITIQKSAAVKPLVLMPKPPGSNNKLIKKPVIKPTVKKPENDY